MRSFIQQNINLLKIYIFGIIIFEVFRLVFLVRFGESGIVTNFGLDIFRSFITGYRFDTQVLCYVLSLPFLFTFLLFIKNERLRNIIIKSTKNYFIILFAVMVFFLLVDHQYYTYFQNHLNILFFGFFEDDTQAVTTSIWTDHPVIIIGVTYLIITFIITKIIAKIYAPPIFLRQQPHLALRIAIIPVILAFFMLGIRGSIGIFPLQIDDSTVSENRFINTMTLNGFFTLEKAIEERAESRQPLYKTEVLKNSHYASIEDVLADYFQEPSSNFSNNIDDALFQTTDTNIFLKENSPNVVFILMESFGGYYLKFHSSSLNLLGNLATHLQKDYLFTNFLSATQGTIFSLEHIMINKDYPLISDTKNRFNSYKTSVAYPFKQAGYQTIFITGGKLGWRNLQEFVPNQYFDEAYGQATITKKNPQAITNTWGVYDEVLFDEIYQRLSENPNQPKMIFVLTTSNHTPYELPKNYKEYPINIPDTLQNLILSNNTIAQANFKAYQYANNCLGNFMTKLKNDKLGDNTIVAATGDHNSYALFPLQNSTIAEEDNYKVPFYLYIPKNYQPNYKINTSRCSSHKDIFPTLINLSLHHQLYFSCGDNLFNPNKPDSLFFGFNHDFVLRHSDLSKKTLNQLSHSRTILNKYYFALP